jgi:hypothetical protein
MKRVLRSTIRYLFDEAEKYARRPSAGKEEPKGTEVLIHATLRHGLPTTGEDLRRTVSQVLQGTILTAVDVAAVD